MKCRYTIIQCWLTIIVSTVMFSNHAYSKGDLSAQQPITVDVQLSNQQGEMKFFPDTLKFETGRLYKLVITNSSADKHYFSSDKFAQSIYTRKVQVISGKSKVSAEIKGAVREIEVYPGDTAEWWFVPVKTGAITDLKCVIPGHAAAGMQGNINIF